MSANWAEKFPEIGGIVHLDHVNFETPDQTMATMFFLNGLGLTRDPYQRADETNMGVNIGMEQFHLPRRGAETPPYHGEVGVVVPRIDVIEARLERLTNAGAFDGTPYAFEQGERTALIRTPFGYFVRLHEAGTIPFQRPLGIAYVETAIPPGTSQAISRFYADVFGAPVDMSPIDGAPALTVSAGTFQSWRFIERELDDYDTHSMHVSFYTTNYNAIRARLLEAKATDDVERDHVYFFDRIFEPETGETVFKVINEVRSLYHPDFRRLLANRWPIIEDPYQDQAEIEVDLEQKLGCVPRG